MKGAVFPCAMMLGLAGWAGDAAARTEGRAYLRELCSERPGLTTAACTVDPGHVQVELGLGSWTLDRQADEREDSLEAGDMLMRYGVGRTTELQLGWIAYGHVRTRDREDGSIAIARGAGDVTLGVKQNLRHPAEGKMGLAAAILPSVTLPVGRSGVGDGDWSAGVVVPLSYKFSDTVSLALSPEVDAAADEDGSGRHLAYGAALGVQVHLTDAMRLSPEIQILHDRDPDQRATMASAALSFDVQVHRMTQFDVQAVAGLNDDAPDMRLSFGISHKF